MPRLGTAWADDEERAYKSLPVYGEVLQKVQPGHGDERTCNLVDDVGVPRLSGIASDPASSYLPRRTEYTDYKQKLARHQSGRYRD